MSPKSNLCKTPHHLKQTFGLTCGMHLVCHLCRCSANPIFPILLFLCGFPHKHCQHFLTYFEQLYIFVGFVTKLLMLACFLLNLVSCPLSLNVFSKQELMRKKKLQDSKYLLYAYF